MKSDEKWWKVGFMLSSGALVLDLNGLEEKRAEEYFFGGKQKHEDVQVSNKKVEELGFMQWSLGLIVEQWENLIFLSWKKSMSDQILVNFGPNCCSVESGWFLL